MDDFEERVRQRAHKLWVEEGYPEGRADVHWDMARELVAIEKNLKTTLQPISSDRTGAWGEPVESALAAENQGELPTLEDQGDQQYPPHRPETQKQPQPLETKASTRRNAPAKGEPKSAAKSSKTAAKPAAKPKGGASARKKS
jgi:hypothetical protein